MGFFQKSVYQEDLQKEDGVLGNKNYLGCGGRMEGKLRGELEVRIFIEVKEIDYFM